MAGPRPFQVKSLKGDWDRKSFQDNSSFETVNYRLSFTFRLQSFNWLWLVDLEIRSFKNPVNIYLKYVTSQESHVLWPYFSASISAYLQSFVTLKLKKILRNGKQRSSNFLRSFVRKNKTFRFKG